MTIRRNSHPALGRNGRRVGAARHSLKSGCGPGPRRRQARGRTRRGDPPGPATASGIWFGWSGQVAAGARVSAKPIAHGRQAYVVIDLTEEDYQEYYNGYANRVLWPMLHYRLDLAEFSRRDLGGYMRVNRLFATELHKLLRPVDVVWVHDYQLLPLGKALHDLGHRTNIAVIH